MTFGREWATTTTLPLARCFERQLSSQSVALIVVVDVVVGLMVVAMVGVARHGRCIEHY